MKRISPIFSPYGYAFNSARLAEARGIYEKMIDDYATICFTLAGAIIPAGLGGAIIEMVKKGLVDFIISTGANLYHDIHFALNLPLYKGSFNVDDRELAKKGIVRIYDIFLPIETLFKTDEYIQENFDIEGNFSTAEIHNYLGKKLLENSKKPDKSLLATCAKYDVPIYCPSPGDSSIGMNLSYLRLKNKKIHTDVERDVLETTAIIYNSKKSGAIILGGGAPKNFFMQTQPMISQIFRKKERGHNYFIQVTSDVPPYGGLSGATPQEAISWKKIDAKSKTYVTVYGDATIIAPLIFSSVKGKRRKHKRLYRKREEFLKKMVEEVK